MFTNMIKDHNGIGLAPCIVTKVRHALGLTDKHPINNKRCRPDYWERTCRVIGMGLPESEINRVINLYDQYIH